MISTSAPPRGERLTSVVFVARDRATGLIHATYTHSYFEGTESEAHGKALDRWTAQVQERVGSGTELHVTTHPAADLNAEWSAHLQKPGKPSDRRLTESSSISRP